MPEVYKAKKFFHLLQFTYLYFLKIKLWENLKTKSMTEAERKLDFQ